MSTDLREELDALARTQTFTPDPSTWDRGRRARGRGRAAAVVAVLVLLASVGGLAIAWPAADREERTASGVVPGGALPSRIGEGRVTFGTWPPQGKASVAYVEGGGVVLVGAEDASSRLYAADDPSLALTRHPLVALSPDGWRLAWTATEGLGIADLRTGEVTRWVPGLGVGARVTSLAWRPGSAQLTWDGRSGGSPASGVVDVTRPSETLDTPGAYGTVGVPSPDLSVVALASDGVVRSAPFLVPGGDEGRPLGRALPTDALPDGAAITPLGWASDDLVVALVDPPPGAEPQPPRLALLTSPDRPESAWTYREFLPRVPPVESLSVAVDLVPDLTGDPDQQLTHDFSAPPSVVRDRWDPPYALAGLLAVLSGFVLVGLSLRRHP